MQDGDSVHATLEHEGWREETSATFVVGCDGAHSAVRHVLKLPFEGAEYNDVFMLADVETNEALPASELQLCPSEYGPVAIFPMSSTRRRIVATVEPADGDAPSLELVQNVLKQRAPIGLEARGMHWSSYFRIHHRQVSEASYRTGSSLPAMPHTYTVPSGEGMNTGNARRRESGGGAGSVPGARGNEVLLPGLHRRTPSGDQARDRDDRLSDEGNGHAQ